jgi:hypothetical protein
MSEPQEKPDNFDMSFRILGNEVIGLSLSSESRARNWAVFGIIVVIILVQLMVDAGPVLVELMRGEQ